LQLRVLIVEDYADAAEALRECLRIWGCAAVVAATGAEALEALREHDPDVVFLDLGLPDVSGWEVAAQIRRDGVPPRPMVVILTALEPRLDVPEARRASFDRYITKPADPAVLQELLSAYALRLGLAGLSVDPASGGFLIH
jgi:CheY-like chemotaxis protein